MDRQDSAAVKNATRSRFSCPRLKVWVFRFLCLLVIPVALLGGLETALRVAGFGYPTHFFRSDIIQGREVYRDNPFYGWLFFSPELSRTPIPFQFDRVKADGTVRIIVVGGSATAGDPEPAYSFSRILHVMLSHRYPERRFEVINAGMTAANSHMVRHLAHELKHAEPDILVVYMGNNEVVGPYGPGTVFTHTPAGLNRVRASIFLRQFKISQLMEAIGRGMGRDKMGTRTWAGMEMFLDHSFGWGDPALTPVYRAFEENLRDIVMLGQGTGAKVLLATVASNLRHCPPFASDPGPGMDADTKAQWEAAVQAADLLGGEGRHEEALSAYRSALSIEDQSAAVHYRLAECLIQVGSADEARSAYRRARDLDRLRFRADSTVNDIVRGQAVGVHAGALELVDIEKIVADASPESVPGNDIFVDHVHFTFEGNYLVAKTLLEAIEAALPSPGGRANSPRAVPGLDACREALAYTGFDETRIARVILKRKERPPFINQLGHEDELEELARDVAEKESIGPASSQDDTSRYEKAVRRQSQDWYLLTGYARLLMSLKQFSEAATMLDRAVATYPYRSEGVFEYAKATAAAGRDIERTPLADRIGKIEPPQPEGSFFKRAGYDLLTSREADGAARLYALALESAPEDGETYAGSGTALLAAGRTALAQDHLLEAIRLQPNAAEALNALGSLHAREGDLEKAVGLFERSRRVNPEYLPARENLARARVKEGRAQAARGDAKAALGAYRQALEVMPGWNEALVELAMVLATHPDPAIHDYPEAVRIAELACPRPLEAGADAMAALSTAYAQTGRLEEAARLATSARQKAAATGDRKTHAYLDMLLDQVSRSGPARQP